MDLGHHSTANHALREKEKVRYLRNDVNLGRWLLNAKYTRSQVERSIPITAAQLKYLLSS